MQCPRQLRFQALTDSVLRPLSVRVLWGAPAETGIKVSGEDGGRLEVFNGKQVRLRPAEGAAKTVIKDNQWKMDVEGGIAAELMVAVDRTGAGRDRPIVTVRSKQRPFSFAADEIMLGRRILVDDLGVLVVRGDDAITLEGYRQLRKEFSGRTVYDRVSDEQEQTLSRAWNDMPLHRPWIRARPARRPQGMRQRPNGDIVITGQRWFHLPHSPKDSAHKGWRGNSLDLGFGLPTDELRGGRELLEGYLPLLRTWWEDGPIYYEQRTILDKLEPDLGDSARRRPDRAADARCGWSTRPRSARHGLAAADARTDQAARRLVVEGDRALAQ